jgi:antitoxin (DNA-binding transcriptional repressor) of toxin-antitoxin stability system
VKTVKVADAKNNLSRHLAYVRRGGTVRILDRDTPVADLVPVVAASTVAEEDLEIARLERLGLARRNHRGPLPRGLLKPGPDARDAQVVEALLEERRSTR